MSNLYEYTHGRGGARTCARSLAVRRWLAIPKASPIGPEKRRGKEMFVRSRARPAASQDEARSARYVHIHALVEYYNLFAFQVITHLDELTS